MELILKYELKTSKKNEKGSANIQAAFKYSYVANAFLIFFLNEQE